MVKFNYLSINDCFGEASSSFAINRSKLKRKQQSKIKNVTIFTCSFLCTVFPTIYGVTHALIESKIDGAFVDSFTITAHLDFIKSHPIRTERTIEHPVTYGMVLAGNSTRMADCARRYLENYPRKVFQRIADHLKPLKVSVLFVFLFAWWLVLTCFDKGIIDLFTCWLVCLIEQGF